MVNAMLQCLAKSTIPSLLTPSISTKSLQSNPTATRGRLHHEAARKDMKMAVVNFVILGSAIALIARFGTLRSRRKFIFYTHALAIPYFLLRGQFYHATLLTLGVCHSVAHHL